MGRIARSVFLAALLLGGAADTALAAPSYGLSTFGDLKYPADFKHFDYVNPDAPKGGTLTILSVVGQGPFDSLNPFILKGTPAAGLLRGSDGPPGETDIYFESLMARALDTTDNLYGLVAESADLAADKLSVTFHMRPQARFHDGSPIRSNDVVYSFHAIMKDGSPVYRLALRDVEKVEAIDPLTVRYSFRKGGNVRDLPLMVAQLPILSEAYYKTHDFANSTLEPPLASGPYRIANVQQGRSITYERDPDYWGKDLPVNVGRYNFDRIVFQYYRDRTVELQAFKAGEFDIREEFTSKSWATEYNGPPFDRGWIKREVMPDGKPSGVQGWFLNLRRDKFADPRVREAFDLAFDFQWTNANLFYGLYQRNDSMFENSPLEAEGTPQGKELALLSHYRDRLPPEVFGPRYEPPKTDGSGNNRDNLRKAMTLLGAAGWHVEKGVLMKDGKPLDVEFLLFEPDFTRIVEPYLRNLRVLGIQAKIRLVDPAQYQDRLKSYDFDVITIRYIPSNTPGPELRDAWGSEGFKEPGTYNLAGVHDPVVDALIEDVIEADNRPDMVTAAHALDRVLMWGHYMVPQWHSAKHFIAYWDKFGRPPAPPRYERGIIDLWWLDKDKAAALAAARGRQ